MLSDLAVCDTPYIDAATFTVGQVVKGAIGPDTVSFGDNLIHCDAEVREEFSAVSLEAGEGMFAAGQAAGTVVDEAFSHQFARQIEFLLVVEDLVEVQYDLLVVSEIAHSDWTR